MKKYGVNLLIKSLVSIIFFNSCNNDTCKVNIFEVVKKGKKTIYKDSIGCHLNKKDTTLNLFYRLNDVLQHNHFNLISLSVSRYKVRKEEYINDSIYEYSIEDTVYGISGIIFFHTNYGFIYYKSLESDLSYKLTSILLIKNKSTDEQIVNSSIFFIDELINNKKGPPPCSPYDKEEIILIRDS